jgi:hypothetical protein
VLVAVVQLTDLCDHFFVETFGLSHIIHSSQKYALPIIEPWVAKMTVDYSLFP